MNAPLIQQPALANAPMLTADQVNFWYGEKQALFDVDLEIFSREIICFMGPSGCGKSTLLKIFNRMHDHIPGARMSGRILFDGQDINDPGLDPVMLRRRFGWVAQKPNPFPSSVRENIAYGPRLHGQVAEGADMEAHVEDCLRRAELWEEVKDRLDDNALELSGGQQQRLCIARALSIQPDMLLMDEPCASVDPLATAAIEDLILLKLKARPCRWSSSPTPWPRRGGWRTGWRSSISVNVWSSTRPAGAVL